MSVLTVRAFWAEALEVVDTDFLINHLWTMPELTLVASKFAEATFIVRTLLLLLGRSLVRLLRMPVDTLSVLLVTVAIFFEKL